MIKGGQWRADWARRDWILNPGLDFEPATSLLLAKLQILGHWGTFLRISWTYCRFKSCKRLPSHGIARRSRSRTVVCFLKFYYFLGPVWATNCCFGRRFGRAPPNLASIAHGAIAKFLARSVDFGRAHVKGKHGLKTVEQSFARSSGNGQNWLDGVAFSCLLLVACGWPQRKRGIVISMPCGHPPPYMDHVGTHLLKCGCSFSRPTEKPTQKSS